MTLLTRPDTSQIKHAGLRLDHQLGSVAVADEMGAAGDGVTDDSAVLVDALSAAGTVVLTYGKTYGISAPLTIPAGTRLVTNGATLRVLGTTEYPAVYLEDDVTVDVLNVTVPLGTTSAGVSILGHSNVEIGALSVAAEDQQGGVLALEANDATNLRIGRVTVSNYDLPILLDRSVDVRIGGVFIDSYVRGLYIESCTGLHIGKSRITVAAPDAADLAGHNGVLIQAVHNDCSDITLEDFYVANSGEHGMRLGGGSFQSRDVRFVRPVIKKTGGGGLKVQAVDAGAPTYVRSLNIKVIDPIFEDIGPADMSSITSGMDSYSALILMYIDGLTVSNPIVRKKDHTFSAKGGMFLTSIVNADIDIGTLRDAKFDGVKLSSSGANNVDSQDVFINGGQAILNGHDGIKLVYPGWVLRRVFIRGVKLSNNTGYGVRVDQSGGTGSISVMHIAADVENNTAGAVFCDSSSVLLNMTGQYNAATAANGSTWVDRVGGVFRVLKAAVWTAL